MNGTPPATAPPVTAGHVTTAPTAATVPITVPLPQTSSPRQRNRWNPLLVAGLIAAVVALSLLYLLLPGPDAGLPPAGRITLVMFAGAVLAWMSGRFDDTFVGMVAVLGLVFSGGTERDDLFGALGGEAIWLLIAAFVFASGLTATGLPARFAALLVSRARTVRQLAHLVTAALLLTALAVPSTSGRAALALPIFLALANGLRDRKAVVRMLALLFPSVILLSAIATLVGAGAHLITTEILAGSTGAGIGFGQWLLLGLPFAAVSSHLCAELVLLLMTRKPDRRTCLRVDPARAGISTEGPLSSEQRRVLVLLLCVVGLWCTESLHGISPALIALLGAVAVTAPRLGTVRMSAALATVPWSLLLFMACTATMGSALTQSGAAGWLMSTLFGSAPSGNSPLFLMVVVVVSSLVHLVLQSRSARSSVLVPLLIPLALAVGMNPAAIVFASTVAAGFCHTLPSSAKPVAMFAAVTEVPTYRRTDLLRLSAVLWPLVVLLVFGFALVVWPALGLPLN